MTLQLVTIIYVIIVTCGVFNAYKYDMLCARRSLYARLISRLTCTDKGFDSSHRDSFFEVCIDGIQFRNRSVQGP